MIIRTNDCQGSYKEINCLDILVSNIKGLIIYFKIQLKKSSVIQLTNEEVVLDQPISNFIFI